MPPTVQQRRGTLAALTAANEIPLAGQIVFETDTNKLKVGNGTTAYNALPYIVGGSGSGGSSALNRTLNSLTFNGSTTTFNLVIGSTAVTPATAASLLILINGVVQTPDVSYTVNGSQITFSVAPATTDTFVGVYLAGAATVFSSPAQIAEDKNNYALSVGANNTRLSTDAARTITGFVAEAGLTTTLHNIGSFSLTVAHQSTSSVAANRVISPTGSDLVLLPNENVTITYDATTARWRASAVGRSAATAWWASSSDKAKLDGIATGATANATDAQLRDRSTHTGQQAISTIVGLQTSLDGKQSSGSYANAVHTHIISAVDGLQAALDGKQVAGSYAATVHSHVIADTSGLQTALDAKQPAGSYAAATHTHTISATTGLQAALDGKQTAGDYATLVGGKVPGSQLPSYVDDVLEFDTRSQFPASGEEGKLYITIDTKKLFRWAGTTYVEIVGSPGSTDAVVEGSNNLYFTTTRAVSAVQSLLDGKAALVHSHSISDVTNLQTSLNGKAATVHTHVIADTTGLQAALDGKQASGSYAAATHSHALADVTGLQSALDSKQPSGSYAAAVHGHTISDVTGLALQLSEKAASSHSHSALDVISGQFDISRIPTGSDASSVCIGNDARLSNARAPTSHQHVVGDVTGLQTALDGKQPSGSYAATVHTHGISDVTGLQTALNGKQASGSYAASSHTHNSSAITDFSSAVAAASPEEVVEYTTAASFPATGNASLLYRASDSSRLYAWVGGQYAEVGPTSVSVSASVTSVAGRTGAVTISAADVSGLGSLATQSSVAYSSLTGVPSTFEDSLLRSLLVPPSPTSLTASSGNAQVVLSWSAPTGVIAQAPITDYVVQASSNSGSTWSTVSRTASTTASQIVTGLTNGTAYVFRVAAVNAVGTGAYTAASSSVTPVAATVPGVVQGLYVVNPGCPPAGQAGTVAWSAPASNGGSPIIGYSVKINANGAVNNVTGTSFSGEIASQTVFVAARNAVGTGSYVSVGVGGQDCG